MLPVPVDVWTSSAFHDEALGWVVCRDGGPQHAELGFPVRDWQLELG